MIFKLLKYLKKRYISDTLGATYAFRNFLLFVLMFIEPNIKKVLLPLYYIMKQEIEVKQLLTGQSFDSSECDELLLESAKACAYGYALATEGVAVLSDFYKDTCYIYAGKFGQTFFGLAEYLKDESTAFENVIFNRVIKEDLLERHILELSFFNYLKNMPVYKKLQYQASCAMRIYNNDRSEVLQILHTTRYLRCLSNGSVWCGLCTYSPFPQSPIKVIGGIVNMFTGLSVSKEEYQQCNSRLLSKRQKEVLGFLAKGYGSKEIAEYLNISFNTVNRHRQDILLALGVSNTVAAVEIGVRMNLI